ncbi:cupin domain-containing protein [Phyllobacterium sp. SB3]|uniref:cupin domain-containing protein n=1 Tax=Phyllobacterium sp. SB3 TaxID=3156073 RepID=UPI0032AEF4BA
MQSKHVHSLKHGEFEFNTELGSIIRVCKNHLPILKGLSIKRLILGAGAIREPHWHANATELAYCVSGKALIGVLDNGSVFSSFIVGAGQMFHIPSGAVHHIENIGEVEAEFIIAFRSDLPEDFSMHAAFGAMTNAVLGNTYDLPGSAFESIARTTMGTHIVKRVGSAVIPPSALYNSPHSFDIEAQNALLDSSAGSARFARVQFWPVLKDISMYSLRITAKGMREPHWHPETAEMGYVQRGHARMTVLDPDGNTDTYELSPGDVYFIPRAYPHHIEQLGSDEVHFLIFFDQPTPGDIGYRATASAFSREVIAATLGIGVNDLPQLPFTPADPLLVNRINARDE